MAGRRRVPEAVDDAGRHGAEVALSGEHLAERVADVDDADVVGVDLGRLQRRRHDTCGEVREVDPSRVKFRAKSLWKPPRIQTVEPSMTARYYN